MKARLCVLLATLAVPALISTAALAQPVMFQKSELRVGVPAFEGVARAPDAPKVPAPAELKKKAEAGDAQAMRDIGLFYHSDQGSDWAVAHEWFLKAARKGDVDAQYYVGRDFWWSSGVGRDSKAALSWLGKAAAAGDVRAQTLLGKILQTGEEGKADVMIVAPDPKRAFKLLKQAAVKENAEAEYGLAHAYMTGEGTKADLKEGFSYLEKAASHGSMVAQRQLGQIYYSGDGNLVAIDHAKSRAYLEQAAEQGDTTSQYFLGRFYEKGLGVEKDGAKAAEWFRKVDQDEMLMDEREQSLVDMLMGAQVRLGVLYRDGFGVKKDPAEAARWFTRAADLGSPVGQIHLAEAYETGAGVRQDKVEAYRWYGIAASNSGSPFAPDISEDIGEKEAKAALDRLEKDMTPEEVAAGKQAAADEVRAQIQLGNAYYAMSVPGKGGYWRILPP